MLLVRGRPEKAALGLRANHCKTRDVILGLVPRIYAVPIKSLKINVFPSRNYCGQMLGTRPSMTEESLSTTEAV
ncbi:hypothetical protein NXC12_PB00155 (plasmid) [Rhizobium etli]|uniref:Uncharacterized protein n=1 Tax=Rhizobium etli TaxID=29449 RepID=A0AAN1BJS6_RHIET|nr:hypothetical protein NXC12_PB00155 [Rhizobium etli]